MALQGVLLVSLVSKPGGAELEIGGVLDLKCVTWGKSLLLSERYGSTFGGG